VFKILSFTRVNAFTLETLWKLWKVLSTPHAAMTGGERNPTPAAISWSTLKKLEIFARYDNGTFYNGPIDTLPLLYKNCDSCRRTIM